MKKLNRFTLRYLYFKLVKQRGSPDSVARGVAIGLFIGFFVPFGGQMVAAFFLAYLLKARKIPAVGCTWVTNHFTVPIFYPLLCYFGSVVIGNPMSLERIRHVFDGFFKDPSFSAFLQMGAEFLIPFLVGGFIVGVVSGAIGYFAALGMIEHHQARKKKRLYKKLANNAAHRNDQRERGRD